MSEQPLTHEYLFDQIKRRLLDGEFAQAEKIDLPQLADAFRVSVTPVRDVLLELVGERLVERHPLGGFRPFALTAPALRDLYAWNGQHLLAALHVLSEPVIRQTIAPVAQSLATHAGESPLDLIERLSVAIASATGNEEMVFQVIAANERLRLARIAERTHFGVQDRELQSLVRTGGVNVQKNVRRRLLAYHRRRVEHASQIAALIA